MQNEEKLKNYVSCAALEHLQNFIIEGLRLSPEEMQNYKNAMQKHKKVKKVIKEQIVKRKETNNYFGEFRDLERQIYKELDIEQKEMKNFKHLCVMEELTNSEAKIVEYLKQGYSYNECAKKLFVSITTLKTHVNNIFQKKGVSSLQELLVLELTGQIKGVKIAEKTKETTYNSALNLLSNLL